MAVEARQQFVGGSGSLEDALITSPHHPLVKYAEAFTKNFDLIAERKSVVFHLRELAKASILAKYVFEGGLNLEDAWFNLADSSMGACALEVPQLWNERFYSQVQVQDGAIAKAEEGMCPRMHGVYGGVQFGLDRFTVGARPATLSATVVGARGVAPRVSAALSMATSVTGGLRAPTMMRAASAMRAGVPSARAAVSMRAGGVARGVDLNLDGFSLSETGTYAGDLQAAEANAPIGTAFWSSIDTNDEAVFNGEDSKLFKRIYNAKLSDRRDEGDLFVPPETSQAYVQKLRSLVKEEGLVQEERRHLFLSSGFEEGSAGAVFPSSWQASFELAKGQSMKQSRHLEARPEYLPQEAVLRNALESAEPTFDKCTEEGTRFRIYRVGRVEVRTTQEPAAEEHLGAVFTMA